MNEPNQWQVTCVTVKGATAFQVEPQPESIEEVQAMRALIGVAPEMREACQASLDFLEGIEACPIRTALYQQLKSILERTEPK